jgi:hypothetical protein
MKQWEQVNSNIKRKIHPEVEGVYKFAHPKDAFKKNEQSLKLSKENPDNPELKPELSKAKHKKVKDKGVK